MLIIFRPFKVGDFIEAAGTAGSVEEIMIFSTKLKSPDNKQLYVPNGSILAGTIVNYSARNQRRVDLVFGCGYGDDIKKTKALLEARLTTNFTSTWSAFARFMALPTARDSTPESHLPMMNMTMAAMILRP